MGTGPAAHHGGTVCGGRDGLRHTGLARPGRPRLGAWRGRLHHGRLSAGRGGVPGRGPDGSRHGRRLAGAARVTHRHDDGSAAHVPAPRPVRRAAHPAPAHPELLVLARLVGAARARAAARSAARPRVALARRAPCPGPGRGVGDAAAGGRRSAGAVPPRLPRLPRQGLGAAGPAHGPAARRRAARHRGRALRRDGPGAPGDVRAGRAAPVRRADALPE